MNQIIFTRILVNSYVAVFKRPNRHGVPCLTHPGSQPHIEAYLYKKNFASILNIQSILNNQRFFASIPYKDKWVRNGYLIEEAAKETKRVKGSISLERITVNGLVFNKLNDEL